MKSILTFTCLAVLAFGAHAGSNAVMTAADSQASPAMAYADESVITGKIKAKLAEESLGSLIHIGVDTASQGAVQLSGSAASQSEADRAVAIARATTGVTSVNSDIVIKE